MFSGFICQAWAWLPTHGGGSPQQGRDLPFPTAGHFLVLAGKVGLVLLCLPGECAPARGVTKPAAPRCSVLRAREPLGSAPFCFLCLSSLIWLPLFTSVLHTACMFWQNREVLKSEKQTFSSQKWTHMQSHVLQIPSS